VGGAEGGGGSDGDVVFLEGVEEASVEAFGAGEKGGFVQRDKRVADGGGVGVDEQGDGELVSGLGESDEQVDFEGVECGEGVEPDLGTGADQGRVRDGEGGGLEERFEIGGPPPFLGGLEGGGPGVEQEGEVVKFSGGDGVGRRELCEGAGGVAVLTEFAEGGVEFLEEAGAVGGGGESAKVGTVSADDFFK